MKLPSVFSAALLASTSLLLAQATPTTPGTKEKPKPLSTSDKAFVKKAGESLYLLSNLSERVRHMERDNKVSPDISALSKKFGATGDVGKAWGEIGTLASNSGDMTLMPTEIKGPDKTKVSGLGKLKDDKFEKEWAEIVSKETKELTKAFESGAKMANSPELKAIAEKFLPAVKGLEDDATKAKANHK
jgi:hypothetical protein